ncbi:MAG TPA: F390 synthetase-related protein [Ktedonobacteraceae bacterium]|jgi:putative adenylate-forming enzyme|nr:F390 synthetase-related protein [Ktedonobacteraceae bacterium]
MMKLTTIPIIAHHYIGARRRWKRLHGSRLEQFQEERARRIVAYTLQHAPFYRWHWTKEVSSPVENWRTLPTVDKQLMMDNFDRFNTRGITREEAMEVALRAERSRNFHPLLHGLTVGLSSGTSGHRGLFLASPTEQAGWAGTMLARALHSIPHHRLRVAFFLRSNSNLYEQIGGMGIAFRYFDLMQPIAEAVVALNDFRPHIIVGPPSLLGFLAQERIRSKLHATPERLISVAEVLEPQDRERIEAVFNAPVHQIYQCTEGLLAVSCAEGSLHIQEDLVMLQFEPLPGSDERVMPVVTDLWRKTQPIIRYRLNDILQLDPTPCRCGSSFHVIRAIEGRCDDICYFESLTGGIRPFFPDTIRRMILLASPHILDYQVVQEHHGHMRIYISPAPGMAFNTIVEAVKASVNEVLVQYDCRPGEMSIEKGLLPLAPGTKRRRVQRVNR